MGRYEEEVGLSSLNKITHKLISQVSIGDELQALTERTFPFVQHLFLVFVDANLILEGGDAG